MASSLDTVRPSTVTGLQSLVRTRLGVHAVDLMMVNGPSLTSLPPEVLMYIGSLLPDGELLSFALTCKALRDAWRETGRPLQVPCTFVVCALRGFIPGLHTKPARASLGMDHRTMHVDSKMVCPAGAVSGVGSVGVRAWARQGRCRQPKRSHDRKFCMGPCTSAS